MITLASILRISLVPAGYTVDPNIPSAFQDTSDHIGLQIGWLDVSATTALNPSFSITSRSTLTSLYAGIVTFLKSASGTTIALAGQAITSTEGTIGRAASYALTGRAITSTRGTPLRGVSYAVTGQKITSSEGTIGQTHSGSAALVGQKITSHEGHAS